MAELQKKYRREDQGGLEGFVFIMFILFSIVFVVYLKFLPMYFEAMQETYWIGVETVEMTADIKKQFNIQSSSGVLITRIFVDSPARQAGLRQGDVIRRWNGTSVTSPEQLQGLIKPYRGDAPIKMAIDRQGKPILVYINVGIRP